MEFSFLSNQDEQLKQHGLQAKPNNPRNPFLQNQQKSNAQKFAQPITIFQQKPLSIFQRNANEKPSIFRNGQNSGQGDDDEEEVDGFKLLMQQNQQRYQQKVADETSKVIADNPLAYEYDTLYDDEKERRENVLAQKKAQRQNLQSRYIKDIVTASERRTREQNAAWESMEKKERINEVENGQVQNSESFITESYRRQIELNQQNKMLEQIEEQMNEKKTANAKTGMMGFYNNFLTRTIETVASSNKIVEQQQQVQALSTRDKLEDKLKQLKQKQMDQENEEKQRRQHEQYDDDPFQIKKAEKAKADLLQEQNSTKDWDKDKMPSVAKNSSQIQAARKRSRSRELEREKKETLKREEQRKKVEEKLAKEAKIKALKDRFKQRQTATQSGPQENQNQ
eukprot:403332073